MLQIETEIERVNRRFVEIARWQDDDFMGIFDGTDRVLTPRYDHLQYYLDGLNCANFNFRFSIDCVHTALDFLMSKVNDRDLFGGDHQSAFERAISKIAEDDRSPNADNMDGSLSAQLFRVLESYLVLEIMSMAVFSGIEYFLEEEKRNSILDTARLAEIPIKMEIVWKLLGEKREYLLRTYAAAVESYWYEDVSLLPMAWKLWQYQYGLPVGHSVFKTINKFEQLFCKKVATE